MGLLCMLTAVVQINSMGPILKGAFIKRSFFAANFWQTDSKLLSSTCTLLQTFQCVRRLLTIHETASWLYLARRNATVVAQQDSN